MIENPRLTTEGKRFHTDEENHRYDLESHYDSKTKYLNFNLNSLKINRQLTDENELKTSVSISITE